MVTPRALGLASIVAAAGCLVSVPDVTAVQCTDDAGCAAPTPYCELAAGVCIECRDASTCPADRPVCDPVGACTTCTMDAHCPGSTCLPDGSCSDPARMVHAAPSGSGSECSAAMPCTLATAFTTVTAERDVILATAGDYPPQGDVSAVALVLATGATIQGDGKNPAITIVDGADLTIVGLSVTDGFYGITCNGGRVRLQQAVVTGNFVGVITGCDLTIERSTIDGNRYGGIYASGGATTITNSFVTDNGESVGLPYAGGLIFEDGATGRVELSTFSGNTGYDAADGIDCRGTHPGLVITSSIIYGNGANAPFTPACPVVYSVVDTSADVDPTNLMADPVFVDAAGGNYHLQPTSPARGAADPALVTTIDHDGDARPQPTGSVADAGADEILD
jgi:hypothetical protein